MSEPKSIMVAKVNTEQQTVSKHNNHKIKYLLVVISTRAFGYQFMHSVLSSLGNIKRWSISLEFLKSSIATTVTVQSSSLGGREQLMVSEMELFENVGLYSKVVLLMVTTIVCKISTVS